MIITTADALASLSPGGWAGASTRDARSVMANRGAMRQSGGSIAESDGTAAVQLLFISPMYTPH